MATAVQRPILPTHNHASDISSIRRRKPQYTVKSPTPGSTLHILTSLAFRSTSGSPPSSAPRPARHATTLTLGDFKPYLRAGVSRSLLEPPLPLYHPLGKLASSLPPLDAALFGLPVLPRRVTTGRTTHSTRSDSSGSNGAAAGEAKAKRPVRARRTVAKLRQTTEDASGASTTNILNTTQSQSDMVDNDEVVDDGSGPTSSQASRKRGGRTKRKRKDTQNDDGDTTYPAKRPRLPRTIHSFTANDEEAEPQAQTPDGSNDGGVEQDSSPPNKRRTRNTRSSRSARRAAGGHDGEEVPVGTPEADDTNTGQQRGASVDIEGGRTTRSQSRDNGE